MTISRQFGAGGKTLGEFVARRLGYQFIDEAIMQKVAEEANVSVRWVEGVEREAGGRLMRVLSSLVPSSFIERHVGEERSDFDESKYVEFLKKVMIDLAKEDNVVFLGRGSQFILADAPDVVKVLLVAERADRILFLMDHYKLERGQAETMIGREERKRARFLANFHGGDVNDPSLYNIVLNTSLIPIEVAELQICDLVLSTVDKTATDIWDF